MADTDMTGQFNTALTPAQQQQYNAWIAKQNMGADPTYDYDMQGAFLAGAGKSGANGHFPDTFKKPNHPTFSTESQYSGQGGYTGGTWNELPGGKWTFSAGPTNMQYHSPDDLQSYFKRVEPDNQLILTPVAPVGPASR
jgi:hypothetical protein